MLRSVLFIDPPAFCTTVEELVAPALRARPIVVAPPGADRALVLALSAEAERAGITRGMALRQARKRCPDLVILPPNPRLYARASRALHQVLARYAPIIEPRWYGHAFLDLTGTGRLFGPAVDVAERIRREAGEKLRLPLYVGVAGNKLVSEASVRAVRRYGGMAVAERTSSSGSPFPTGKGDRGLGRGGRQDGKTAGRQELFAVPSGDEAQFLAPHPTPVLPDVPEKLRIRLEEYQLDLIGEIASLTEPQIGSVLGTPGIRLLYHARGIDPRPVLPPAVKAEFQIQHTLATDTNDLGHLHTLLRRMTERLGRRLRRRGLSAGRLSVTVTWSDYKDASRGVPLAPAMLDVELWNAARRAFTLACVRPVSVRMLGVRVDRLTESDVQLDLWRDREEVEGVEKVERVEVEKTRSLQRAVDRIHRRWGERSLLSRV